jgi:hypothetical protein
MDDFILDESGDLLLQNGDFVKRNANPQHVEDILQTIPGEYKMAVFVGCDLPRFLKSSATKEEVSTLVQKQLSLDGFTVFSVDVQFMGDQFSVIPYCDK